MKGKRYRLLTISVLIVLGLSKLAAIAENISVFGDLTDFDNAVGNVGFTVEDFTNTSHFPISTGILNENTNLPAIGILPGDIQPGVTYSTPIGTGFFFNIDSAGGFTGGFLDSLTPAFSLAVDFDQSVSAFGFDTNELMGNNFDLEITFDSRNTFSQNFSVTQSTLPLQFFGFQSDLVDIQSATIHGNGSSGFGFALDDFRFTTAAIPEPSTYFSYGGMLFGLFLLVYYRARKETNDSV